MPKVFVKSICFGQYYARAVGTAGTDSLIKQRQVYTCRCLWVNYYKSEFGLILNGHIYVPYSLFTKYNIYDIIQI